MDADDGDLRRPRATVSGLRVRIDFITLTSNNLTLFLVGRGKS